MFIRKLSTISAEVELVEPQIERDARLGVAWLAGQNGRRTLKLMGVAGQNNQPSTIEEERKRVAGFLTNQTQYNWMISRLGKIVGSVWVDRTDSNKLKGPAISIMIGDPAARGQGIGYVAVKAVVDFLRSQGAQEIFTRHIIGNQASAALFRRLGFEPHGKPYIDSEDNLTWQNLVRKP